MPGLKAKEPVCFDKEDRGQMAASGSTPGAADTRVAGMGDALEMMREFVGWPLQYGAEAEALGLEWPRGLLLHGPPGTGKTLLVHAVAQEFGAKLHYLSSSNVFGAYAGESERRLRETFAAAQDDACKGIPAIIFIDEIDTLCPKRDSRRQQEARVVAQLLTLMDGASAKGRLQKGSQVLVVAATNRPNSLDPALRRPGRFEREVAISVPNKADRLQILQLHSAQLPLAEDVDLASIAASCSGYSGADLAALCREAAMSAMGSELQSPSASEPSKGSVEVVHFEAAMQMVGPSIGRGAAAEVPSVKWEDIGGLHDVKKRLRQVVEWPLKHAAAFSRLGLSPPRGVLLHGPPGCSKTTLARATAHAANATLFSLSGAELFSMFVGDGEALLRETFRKARLVAPSIVFFDEVDALATRRAASSSGGGRGGTSVAERLLSSLLTEMDGLELARGVLVLAATNRPQAIDAALMRPGRFDVVLYVPPPDEAGRLEALQVHTRGVALAEDVNLVQLAAGADLFTGAELAALCREAALTALREDISSTVVSHEHFDKARAAMRPALTPLMLHAYAAFSTK